VVFKGRSRATQAASHWLGRAVALVGGYDTCFSLIFSLPHEQKLSLIITGRFIDGGMAGPQRLSTLGVGTSRNY